MILRRTDDRRKLTAMRPVNQVRNPSVLPLKSHRRPARFWILGALTMSIQFGTPQDLGLPKPPQIPDRWRIEFLRQIVPVDRKPEFRLAGELVIHTQSWYVAVC